MQSGCMFNSWAFQEKHIETALNLAIQLGCQKDDPKEIVKSLRNVPAADLVFVGSTKLEVGKLRCGVFLRIKCTIK